MSGGVDSSVAACLLKEQGYDVVGVFMRLGAVDPAVETQAESPRHDSERIPRHRGCCSAADSADARAVAGRLGIPFYALNFEPDFAKLIDYFADEYAAGRTPNPCILCNHRLKFGKLRGYARAIDVNLIATGHYARIDTRQGRPRLRRAKHLAKDQSYVLFQLEPDALRQTRFPLGELSKEEVRAIAKGLGLSLHDKPDSQDICFVPDRDYAPVVHRRRPDAFRPGDIRHTNGQVLGKHDGMARFTIGQRRGLRIAAGAPLYVTDIDPDSATVTVGPREATLAEEALATNVLWHGGVPASPLRADIKIRYNHTPVPAEVAPLPGGRVRVRFNEPQPAVTPGQALVMYDGDVVLGGGWLTRLQRRETN